jgi:choline transport protein
VASILATVNIGDPAAFNGVISLTIVSVSGSYLIITVLLLEQRLAGRISEPEAFENTFNLSNTIGRQLTWGLWRLRGVFGVANNVFACCYLTFIMFFGFWPATTPVTPKNMNWAVLVTIVVVFFSSCYYMLWAKRSYAGPRVEVEYKRMKCEEYIRHA